MGRFAEGTAASVENTRGDLERVLRRYGAEGVVIGWEGNLVALRFKAHGRYVMFRMTIPLPDDKQFRYDGRNSVRTPAQRQTAALSEEKRLWRCLLLAIKAKLEVVVSGIATFEEEFASHTVLPDGSTVGEWLLPQVEETYRTGEMPALMPGLRELSAGAT